MEKERIMGERQRLDKLLGNSGYGSRKEIRNLVKQRRVTVDGHVVNDPGIHVEPGVNRIRIDDIEAVYKKFIYIMMNKPGGVISATHDKRHETVIDLLPEEFSNFDVFPAGRLDIDTEGLVLLTNDGQLAHEILSPRKHIPKTYYVHVNGTVTDKDKKAFSEGIVLDDGYNCLPSELDIIKSSETSEVNLTIYEGKFHQVKRMFESLGKKVVYLKRISMGGLKLDPRLEPGQCREITDQELNALKNNC